MFLPCSKNDWIQCDTPLIVTVLATLRGVTVTGEPCNMKNCPHRQESRRGSAISLFISDRKKKWPSLFGGKKKGRAGEDDGGYASEVVSDVRLREFEQVRTLATTIMIY